MHKEFAKCAKPDNLRPTFVVRTALMRIKQTLIHAFCAVSLLFLTANGTLRAQVVEDFGVRFQAQQNGGIQFLANTSLYCGYRQPMRASPKRPPHHRISARQQQRPQHGLLQF